MRKIAFFVVSLIFAFSSGLSSALAEEIAEGKARVVMGADLDEEQRAQIYRDFSLAEGDIQELTITNQEERAYLEGIAPEDKIGNLALSCVYIRTLEENSGLTITLHNINWCSENMYRNVLVTAGITDANVMISAPYPVSGTAALLASIKPMRMSPGKSWMNLQKRPLLMSFLLQALSPKPSAAQMRHCL